MAPPRKSQEIRRFNGKLGVERGPFLRQNRGTRKGMSMNAHRAALLALAPVFVLWSGCAQKAFTKGEYDDPTKVVLLDDKFNEGDMQQMAETIVQAMTSCPTIATAKKPPVVM